MPSQLNVFIVDDDNGVREALASLLVSRQYRVQAFESGEQFLAKADIRLPGCLILDVRMGDGLNGLEVFDRLRKESSPLVVIFLSAHLDIAMATSYTRKGVFECLEKNSDEDGLLLTLGLATQRAIESAAIFKAKQQITMRWETLTDRESDVAKLVRLGWSNKLIARELSIGVRSVESHRAKVYEKMWASNPIELDCLLRESDTI